MVDPEILFKNSENPFIIKLSVFENAKDFICTPLFWKSVVEVLIKTPRSNNVVKLFRYRSNKTSLTPLLEVIVARNVMLICV